MNQNSPDLERLRREYANRSDRLKNSTIYSLFNPVYLFTWQQRQRTILRLLGENSLEDMSRMNILEVGCGGGGVLQDLLKIGASPSRLTGVDLLIKPLHSAAARLPQRNVLQADGQNLPFPASQFHLVLQFTAFSSVLDNAIRQHMAAEMLRVLKPEGAVLWYDFWLNPTNPHTRGIRPAEIKALFPGCSFTFHKITLAPPIARRIVPISWGLAQMLESLKFFNSHYLVLIRKNNL